MATEEQLKQKQGSKVAKVQDYDELVEKMEALGKELKKLKAEAVRCGSLAL